MGNLQPSRGTLDIIRDSEQRISDAMNAEGSGTMSHDIAAGIIIAAEQRIRDAMAADEDSTAYAIEILASVMMTEA